MRNCIAWLDSINKDDALLVGDKNAPLGEMLSHISELGITVPSGFATTTYAFKEFLDFNNLTDWIDALLFDLNIDNVQELVTTGETIRQRIMESSLPDEFAQEVSFAYRTMLKNSSSLPAVTVATSATGEDSGDALFAGQQESIKNIKGVNNIIDAIKQVYASLYNDRAIAYRINNNIPNERVAASVSVQYFGVFAQPIMTGNEAKVSDIGKLIQLGYYTPTQRFIAQRK